MTMVTIYALGYLVQLVLCYFMIRQMYIWDDLMPVGMLIFFAFILFFGFASELIILLIEFFAVREYEHDWDLIWSKFLRINK